MNPKMSEVDIVPDDDLNTRLKFYVSDKPDDTQPNSILQETPEFQCENIVEDQEETILQLFAQEAQDMDIELCSKRWYRTDLKVIDSKNETFIKY